MRKIICLFLTVIMCLQLSACSESSSSQESSKKDESNLLSSESISIIESSSSESEVEVDKEEEQKEEKEIPVAVDTTPILNVGEAVSIADICEFYIEYIDITKKVMPKNPSGLYSYYSAENGKIYIDICVSYKNLEAYGVDADEIASGKLIYADKYEYSGFSTMEEDNRRDFTYTSITDIDPLSTEYLHYLFEVPEEVGKSEQSIIVKFTIKGERYKIVVREGEESEESAEEKEVGKTSGDIGFQETVITENCEFYIDYADISKEVIPPAASGLYSYYKADSGKVYVDICFAYKNTMGNKVMADEIIEAKLKYADEYEYYGFTTIEEDSRRDFTYTSITSIAPLSTEYVHYLFELPEDAKNDGKTIVVTITIDGNTYNCRIR